MVTSTTTTTNLGPLTTTFTPPRNCTIPRLGELDGGGVYAQLGQSCSPMGLDGETLVAKVAESCFPGDLGSYINSNGGDFLYTVPVYSPGSVCPSGFEKACTMERHEGDKPPEVTDYISFAKSEIWNILKYDQTAIGCCPSGYECAGDNTIMCTSIATPGHVFKGTSYSLQCLPTNTTATVAKTQKSMTASARRLILIQGKGRPVPTKDTSKDDDGKGSDFTKNQILALILPIISVAIILFIGVPCFIVRRRRRRQLMEAQMNALGDTPPGQNLVSRLTGLNLFGEAPPSYGEAIALVPQNGGSHQDDVQSDASGHTVRDGDPTLAGVDTDGRPKNNVTTD